MMNIQTLAKYPFLSDSKKYVRDNTPTLKELFSDPLYERARESGIERLENAFKMRDVGTRRLVTESDFIMELMSYPIARMIVVCIGDTYFKRRYALSEAYHVYKNLINEPTEFLVKISKEFDMDVIHDKETNEIRIYFIDYLNNAPTRYKEWKMTNRSIKNGYILLSHKGLARIMQEALRKRINDELDSRECDKNIANAFLSDIKRMRNQLMMHKKKIEAVPTGKLSIDKLPPCMRDILAAIQSGENVPHMGRFALVTFLNSLKFSLNDILKLFSTAPDYEEDKTRYQVEHITGSSSSTKYSPPGCDKMRTYGICPIDKVDELCKKKRHPLSYYKAKWKEK